MHYGVDEHQMKKRSFAFSLAYIKCFLAYSLSLSLRLPAQILYAGIHLPPQREARRLRRKSHRFNFVVKVWRKRYHLSPIQPLSFFARKGKKTAPLTQGSRDSLCKRPQRPLHRGAEKALRGLFCLRIKITSARLHRLWRGSESSLQRRQRIFHP